MGIMNKWTRREELDDSILNLSELACRTAFRRFSDNGYYPTESTKLAISGFIEVLERCLLGTADPEFYLSSIDCGLGKTESAVAFLSVWKERGFSPDGSIIIGLSRKSEIRSYIERAGLEEADFAVLTSDNDMNLWGVGAENADTARILFTTQQMIVSRTRQSSFTAAKCFHYRGRARDARIWDESLIPAMPVHLRMDSLKALPLSLRRLVPEFIGTLEAFIAEVDAKEAGDAVLLPEKLNNPTELDRATRSAFWHHVSETDSTLRSHLETMAGRTMIVCEDNLYGRLLIGCSGRLPSDFAPAIILDASGRVRSTYSLWEKHRGGLRRLPAACNDYGKLDLKYWDRSAGRSALENRGSRQEILEAAATLINDSAGENWLVIHHKHRPHYANIPAELSAMLARPDRVGFLHWGDHHGTNAFRAVRNVLVIGLWLHPESTHLAQHMACSGLSGAESLQSDWKNLRWSETQHNLLQAICRSSVRNSSDGTCGACCVYLIAAPGHRLRPLLQATFPGCTVETWEPVRRSLSGKARALVDLLSGLFANPAIVRVGKREVREALAHSSKTVLPQLLRRADVQRHLAESSITVGHRDFTRASNGALNTMATHPALDSTLQHVPAYEYDDPGSQQVMSVFR